MWFGSKVIFILCAGIQGSKALSCCSSAKPVESASEVMVNESTTVRTCLCYQLRYLVDLNAALVAQL